jgi:thiosulfate/3-mercaptopyruvate sulfurtransferase
MGKDLGYSEGRDQSKEDIMTTPIEVSSVVPTFAVLPSAAVWARDVSPFVSTDWVQQNLENSKVVTVDTRKVEEYKGGHIPGAVSAPFGSWIVERNKLLLELPADDDLINLIGSLGIKPYSTVVVVSTADNDYSRADATRVAWTMIVAGLKNVAVLEGGYAKWLKEQKAVSTEAVSPKEEAYKGKVNKDSLASKAYVMNRIGKSVIVDNRDASVYFGVATEPFAPKAGHIGTAVNLPTPWVYTKEGALLPEETLEAMAVGVIGKDRSKEVICYCGVGGYASTWWFILTQMLGYRNVKFYDGSAQDWVMDPKAPMSAYRWH